MDKSISVVTGGNGFVGSHLVDFLLAKGNIVKCIVRKSSNLQWLKDKPVEIFNTGLFDIEELKKILIDADYLYHVAGVVKAKEEKGYFEGNVETTRNLLETIAEVNPGLKRIVIVSSQTACGPSLNGETCNEVTKPHPLTTYGRSKIAQEMLAREYMDKLPITIVRPPAVFGERDTEIYLIFKTFKMRLLTLIGFNDKKLSLIHSADLVKGIYLAATSEKSKGETYFIGSEVYYDWNQVGNAIAKAMGHNALRLKLPHFIVYTVAAIAQFFAMFSSKAATFNLEKARDFVQEAWTCDTAKAVRELGYRQEITLEEGIKRTIDWYREHKWL
jgi:nucleoside-diphosphate-sugar epimerase